MRNDFFYVARLIAAQVRGVPVKSDMMSRVGKSPGSGEHFNFKSSQRAADQVILREKVIVMIFKKLD